jgi:hypothetical protein
MVVNALQSQMPLFVSWDRCLHWQRRPSSHMEYTLNFLWSQTSFTNDMKFKELKELSSKWPNFCNRFVGGWDQRWVLQILTHKVVLHAVVILQRFLWTIFPLTKEMQLTLKNFFGEIAFFSKLLLINPVCVMY